MASTMDLLPTFASLAGEPFASQVPIDGLDISRLFGRQVPTTSPRNTFAYYGYFNAENQYRQANQVLLHAVREGRWKLILHEAGGTRRVNPKASDDPVQNPGEIQLFDMQDDPSERINLAEKDPETVQRLARLLEKYINDGRSTSGPVQENEPPGLWQKEW